MSSGREGTKSRQLRSGTNPTLRHQSNVPKMKIASRHSVIFAETIRVAFDKPGIKKIQMYWTRIRARPDRLTNKVG